MYYFIYKADPGTPANGVASAKRISKGARTTSDGIYVKVVVDDDKWMDLHNAHPEGLTLIEFGPGLGNNDEDGNANGFGVIKEQIAV